IIKYISLEVVKKTDRTTVMSSECEDATAGFTFVPNPSKVPEMQIAFSIYFDRLSTGYLACRTGMPNHSN
ncbi:MAG TPA: hypothetical protein DCX41_03455, partial [Aequorivita sp.]|nr:hypothetical protein [Aequorivita sp.]